MKTSIYSPEYEAIRNWFREKRNEKGLSLRDVAKLAERHHSVFGKIETERKLDIVEFVQYCQVLEIDPHEGIDLIIKSITTKPPAF